MINSLDEKIKQQSEALKGGFRDFLNQKIAQALDEYWKKCNEHADLLYTYEEREEFLTAVHKNIKEVLRLP